MNRKFLVLVFFAALVAAGCGGGSSLAPAPGMNPGMGTIGVQLDVRFPTGVARKADFLGAGADRISYTITAGSTTVASSTVMLNACSGSGSSRTCSIGLAYGTGYQLSLTLLAGSVVLGSGTSNTFNLVANSSVPTIGISIAPVLSGATIQVANTRLTQDGTLQAVVATVQELDPNANVINTGGGSVSNWLTLTPSASGDGGTLSSPPTPVASPPSVPNGSSISWVYSGGVLGGTPQGPITFQVTDGVHTPQSVQVPVTAITVSPSSFTFAALSTPQAITITEYNTPQSSFNASTTCANTDMSFGGPTLTGTPSSVSGTLTGSTLTLTLNVSALVANKQCALTVAANDFATLTQTITLTSPSGITIGISDKRRHGN